MEYICQWKDEHRAAKIKIWQEDGLWRWYYQDDNIRDYKQGRQAATIGTVKRFLRKEFYIPKEARFKKNLPNNSL